MIVQRLISRAVQISCMHCNKRVVVIRDGEMACRKHKNRSSLLAVQLYCMMAAGVSERNVSKFN
jgi:hypothetical protein